MYIYNKPNNYSSVIELTEQGHTALYPVLLWFVCGEFHGYDVVGGVPSSGEGTSPIAGLV